MSYASVKNTVATVFCSNYCHRFLAALSRRILRNSEWTGNDMQAKIHFLWQPVEIVQIRHFS
jgi:hypothetical protein